MTIGRDERSRWYSTARWQKIRARQLAAEPLCRTCRERGHITVATVCDHVEHRDDNSTFWTGPFQSLCAPCHDSTKQSAEKRGYERGSDASGMPVDPAHPWNDRVVLAKAIGSSQQERQALTSEPLPRKISTGGVGRKSGAPRS